jgi:hypothetical protein
MVASTRARDHRTGVPTAPARIEPSLPAPALLPVSTTRAADEQRRLEAWKGAKLSNPERNVVELFAAADVRVNGDRPWDVQVKDDAFYRRVLSDPRLELGETYMDGLWECDRPPSRRSTTTPATSSIAACSTRR